ncbi:cation:proton antiporter [Methylophilaceae bacterium]|nr:cation:proton antiporter [Methylophilaceae bacterium]MDC1011349.1 cation:proton antiporter [Methylophilaceae bacterium]
MLESTELIIILLLVCSVVFLTVFKYFKLSATIAYFAVGILLGPSGAGILYDSDSIRHFVEFGIVFLMFSIGLEFSLPKLNSMRGILFGLGGAQVFITLATTFFVSRLFGLDLAMAFVIGSALTMSSTAIVSKILIERIDLNSRHGRLSIGILLFQDIAVIPILILLPALSAPTIDINTLFIPIILKIAVLLSILFWLGKPIINFWFGLVAQQKSRELFVLNVLMVTMFFAYLTHLAGLSYALGAFLAGMLISETRYRYQVESDIASFRDILLGLFFISVGMMLNLNIFIEYLWIIITIFIGYSLFKATLIALLTKAFKYEFGVGIRTGIILGQAGEFSFVILALAKEQNIIGGDILQIILSVCLLSMICAPFLIPYNGRIARFLSKSYIKNSQKNIEKINDIGHNLSEHVILCGYGRSGQFLGRFLKEEHIPFIAIDMDLNRVNDASNAGELVMYGDASRRVVLNAAGIKNCKAVIITYADDRASSKVLTVVRETYADLPVIVRTADESSIALLQKEGATEVVPEVLEGSLMLGSHALMVLGIPLGRIVKKIRSFRSERYAMFRGYFKGSTDISDDFSGQEQLELHSIEVKRNPLLMKNKLENVRFEDFNIQIQYLRRPNMLENIDPRPDIILDDGDILVILGLQQNINHFEKYISSGKIIS